VRLGTKVDPVFEEDRGGEGEAAVPFSIIPRVSGGRLPQTTHTRIHPGLVSPFPSSRQALPQMKDKFFASGNRRGLRRNPFVHAVFMHLYETTKGLHVKADAARVVAMLDELFDQIEEYHLVVCRDEKQLAAVFFQDKTRGWGCKSAE